jgi:competence protein ComEA
VPSVSISRPAALVLASLLLGLLVIAGNRLAGAGAADSGAPEAVAPLEPVAGELGGGAGGPSARAEVVVHVVGAVRRPGLLRLREGARVADAVARAGGATGVADLTGVNLAAPAVDGVQIFVPTRIAAAGAGGSGAGNGADTGSAPGVAGVGAAAGPGVAGRKLSLATATAEELDELPGVGPVTAQKILDYRSQHGAFRSIEDLDAVPGIGPARIEQLRELVTP